jgi:aminomethyltransferase
LSTDTAPIARTPLYDLHRELGARIVPFAGYAMPLNYARGIIEEHTHTRTLAGLFDVSHMGQIRVSAGAGAATRDAAIALEALLPTDLVGLAPGRQRYAFLTDDAGGVLDDLMITSLASGFLLVVNAACKARDLAHLEAHCAGRSDSSGRCSVELLDGRALLALQGPAAADVMTRLAPEAAALPFMSAATLTVAGSECWVSRSGYTGEDGFEISVDARQAEMLARTLLTHAEVAPAGLGARDSLRLEAGLCLYGRDLDPSTTPVEAGLTWALSRARRAGGARPGGYPGADIIERQLDAGVARRRVGLTADSRVPVRSGCELLDAGGRRVGSVTSGGFGPTLQAPVAMGYVASAHAEIDARLTAVVRGKAITVRVARLPFVPHRYRRVSATRRWRERRKET